MRKRAAKTPKAPTVAEDDVSLFREAIGEVRRIEGDDRTTARAAPPPARPVQFLRDEARVVDELLLTPDIEAGDELSYLRDGHDPRLLKRLRGGQFAVQDEFDLHRLHVASARTVIREFIAEAVAHDYRCVRLIHGKGLRSSEGPVLKRLVDGMLRQHGDVIAFASAPANAGGTGAVLVLLRRR